MICVSIGRGRHRHIIAEHQHLVSEGAGIVELRIDYINGEPNIRRLTADRPGPIIITCRRPSEGGKYAGDEAQRLLLLRSAIAEGVDYVDLEEDIAHKIPRWGKTKRIISFHDFRKTPDDIEAIHERICALDPDIVKICTMANRPSDNLRMLRMVRKFKDKIPTVGFCMGDIGTPSRILCGKFGSPLTYATFSQERALAPGQLTFQQMKEIYRYDHIGEATEVYGVVADPIGHSLSPLIHNGGFAHFGLDKVYVPFRVPREDLGRFLDEAAEWNLKGLSVTIPHKEEVVKKLTESDEAVQGIGACNTVVIDGARRAGYNTDYCAAMDSLSDAMRLKGDASGSLAGKTALLLGAGGVGMAIAYGLVQRGAAVVVTDAQPRAAAALAMRWNCRAVDWAGRHGVSADLLFNCTPVGMHPEVDATPFDKHYLKPSMVVFDAVYNPENTMLIKDARARNCTVVTGVDMFVRQACLQFKHFTGLEGPADLMREAIKRATAAAKM